jgi:ribosomal protein L11 methylase PrmA
MGAVCLKRRAMPRSRPAKLLILTLKPKDLEPALGLLLETGVTTLEEKRCGPDLQLHLQIPAKTSAKALEKNLRVKEKKLFKPLFKSISLQILKDESWKTSYQRFLKPFEFPPYPPSSPPLIIDPTGPFPKKPLRNTLIIQGQLAFGTGHHPSTQLAGYLMQKAMVQKSVTSLLDVGTGTGILAMVAYRRGLKKITAVENDPEARRVAQDNFGGNKIRGVQLLDRLAKVRGRYPLIVANIIAKTLSELKEDLESHLQTGGSLILAGLNYRDIPGMLRTFRGFQLRERKNKKGWCALWLEKKKMTGQVK